MGMAMGGAITAVAATTTVGIGVTTMGGGGIITIGGDFYLKATKGPQWLAASFSLDVAIKDFRGSVAIADKPTQRRALIFCCECPAPISGGRNPAVRRIPCCSFPFYIGRQHHFAP